MNKNEKQLIGSLQVIVEQARNCFTPGVCNKEDTINRMYMAREFTRQAYEVVVKFSTGKHTKNGLKDVANIMGPFNIALANAEAEYYSALDK